MRLKSGIPSVQFDRLIVGDPQFAKRGLSSFETVHRQPRRERGKRSLLLHSHLLI